MAFVHLVSTCADGVMAILDGPSCDTEQGWVAQRSQHLMRDQEVPSSIPSGGISHKLELS